MKMRIILNEAQVRAANTMMFKQAQPPKSKKKKKDKKITKWPPGCKRADLSLGAADKRRGRVVKSQALDGDRVLMRDMRSDLMLRIGPGNRLPIMSEEQPLLAQPANHPDDPGYKSARRSWRTRTAHFLESPPLHTIVITLVSPLNSANTK